MSRKLKTMDAETLMTTPMEPLKFIVSSLLPEGLCAGRLTENWQELAGTVDLLTGGKG